MKTKQLLILLGILVVLVVIVGLVENPFAKSEYAKKMEAATPLFPDFNKEDVVKIEITASGETTTLANENEQWLVASMDNYPADAEGVADVLDKVGELKSTGLVSSNPEKQAEFEVDSSGAEAKLLGAGGNVLAHLFLGKTTPGYLSSYVRAADSNDVYVGKGNLKATFDKGTRTWKDRTIFSFNKGDVTHLTIRSEEEETELEMDAENKWQMTKPEPFPAIQTELDSLLDSLSSLDTDDFAEANELSEYELDDPKSSVLAKLNDGSTRFLLIGKEESGKHYVKRDDKDPVFMLFQYKINQLLKKSEDLKDDTPVAEDETPESEESESGDGE
ncbi:MAG: DUF4340 domain-containing protein [Candidatus Poribacteria bacterium]|nr:DUF4340 domain-containing protein [Candidatus Poribacteria bacterium]MDE0503625.1 DUF4340 domain-containing protein [Candidatus Poribacteria bacterium]